MADELGYRLQVRRADAARLVDLELVRQRGGNYRAGLGRSTRAGVNRAIRLYEARGGIEYRVAGDVDEALEFFDELERLHRAVWAARGKSDAFARTRRLYSPSPRPDPPQHGCRRGASLPSFGGLVGLRLSLQLRLARTRLQLSERLRDEDDNRIKPGLVSHVLGD